MGTKINLVDLVCRSPLSLKFRPRRQDTKTHRRKRRKGPSVVRGASCGPPGTGQAKALIGLSASVCFSFFKVGNTSLASRRRQAHIGTYKSRHPFAHCETLLLEDDDRKWGDSKTPQRNVPLAKSLVCVDKTEFKNSGGN